MKTIGTSGFLTSNEDDYALADFLLVAGKEWTQGALDGMTNKAVKLVVQIGLPLWKEAHPGDPVPLLAELIPAIIALPNFKPNQILTPSFPSINHKFPPSVNDWTTGFEIEDYQDDASKAIYEDPEEMLRWFFTNKIFNRRKAFVDKYEAQFLRDQVTFPSIEDDFIDFTIEYPGYQNRAQRG